MLHLLKDLIAELAAGLVGCQLFLEDQNKFKCVYAGSSFFLTILFFYLKNLFFLIEADFIPQAEISHLPLCFFKKLLVRITRVTRLIETGR